MDTERNERLAVQMGWERSPVPGQQDLWRPNDQSPFQPLRNFSGHDCAAVKYLLPWLRKKVTVSDTSGILILCDPNGVKIVGSEDEAELSRSQDSLSLALAAAVEGLKVGS